MEQALKNKHIKKKRNLYIVVIAVLAIVGILIIFKPFGKAVQVIDLKTEKVIRGDISDVITATGTLEALETVEVGTQVSGVIEKIYVDYNSQVKKGQLLAKLDETPLIATLGQSKASVDNAQAEVDYQEATYERYKVLAEKKLIAQSDFDLVVYNYHKAVASLKNARSVYDKNKINLDYATIYSPIDGIILERAVDEGQTVAASFSTPTLFTIANDLTQMQVEADVDEADIGRLKVGQRVEFTVDAYPDKTFTGEVTQIRLQPVESSNVITYTVIIDAPNPEKKLMPGMTASVSFYVTEKKNILLLPSRAVNLNPDQKLLLDYKENHPEIDLQVPSPPMIPEKELKGKMIWMKKGNLIYTQKVELGETNEIYYEVLSGVEEGDEVIVTLSSVSVNKNENTIPSQSPFMPKPPGRNRK
ncbi:MAG: efflux RND transporter periplasmic adaptor subunit [Bacteroidales bacterium]|nr:efflux RND transporter periplasmic adaptor subunit [Bacteroidales bacterium]